MKDVVTILIDVEESKLVTTGLLSKIAVRGKMLNNGFSQKKTVIAFIQINYFSLRKIKHPLSVGERAPLIREAIGPSSTYSTCGVQQS